MSELIPYVIAPSILTADMAKLGEECQSVLEVSAHEIHFDVMDNHYVPNLTLGPAVCQALRQYGIKAPIDVHLMTENVDELSFQFAEAGASNFVAGTSIFKKEDRAAAIQTLLRQLK